MKAKRLLILGCLIAGACGALLPQAGWAQETEKPPRKVAFLVGVTVFDHSELPKLNFPENDVVELGKVLESQGYEVTVLSESQAKKSPALAPLSRNIRTQLDRVLKDLTSSDIIIVGLAGHGLQHQDESYFCPRDAVPTTKKVAKREELYKPESLIRISEILETLRGSNVGDKLIFVDACRSEPISGKTRSGVSGVGQIKLPPQTGVLLSCGDGQFAFESEKLDTGHGVFFYHVIQGLKRGAADADGDVTWGNLTSYVQKNVPKTVKKLFPGAGAEQSPHAKTEMEGEQSIIARINMAAATVTGTDTVTASVLAQPLQAPADKTTIEEVQNQWAVQLGFGNKRQFDNSFGMRFVIIPPGQFKGAEGGVKNSFHIASTEVTREQWMAVMGKENRPWEKESDGDDDPQLPANGLSFEQAQSFCEKLTELEHASGKLPASRSYRLPTEVEWKWACRAGVEGTYNFTGTKTDLKKYAWFGEDEPSPVGKKAPNAFGLYDTLGNVSEWCSDHWARGASFQRTARHVEVENKTMSVTGNSELGFRPLMTH